MDYAARYIEFDAISQSVGWASSEMKKLPVPERRFWAETAKYRLRR